MIKIILMIAIVIIVERLIPARAKNWLRIRDVCLHGFLYLIIIFLFLINEVMFITKKDFLMVIIIAIFSSGMLLLAVYINNKGGNRIGGWIIKTTYIFIAFALLPGIFIFMTFKSKPVEVLFLLFYIEIRLLYL